MSGIGLCHLEVCALLRFSFCPATSSPGVPGAQADGEEAIEDAQDNKGIVQRAVPSVSALGEPGHVSQDNWSDGAISDARAIYWPKMPLDEEFVGRSCLASGKRRRN